MRRGWAVFSSLAMCLFLAVSTMGMGGLGSSGPVRIPEPAENFSATIMDQSDTSTRVQKVSFDGQTSINGKRGEGRLSIGFEKIDTIDFILEGGSLKANIELKSGENVSLAVEKGTPCYGALSFGNFAISVEDIRRMTFHGLAENP